MKGVSSMIAAVLLVLITIVASVFLSGWLTSTSSAQAERIKNNTNTQLQCQFADMYIKKLHNRNAAYNYRDAGKLRKKITVDQQHIYTEHDRCCNSAKP